MRIARLLLAVFVAVGCHAEGQSTPTRPSVERRAAEPPAVEDAPSEHSADENDEIRRNARRPEYAAFFNALKRQVAQSWDLVSVWRSVDPTATVYGSRTRVTEVRVSLSRSGEVAKLMVTSPSGVTELDDEALRAFRTAGPFPPPPDGLVSTDDLVTFPFSFFFEIGSHVKRSTPGKLPSAAPSSTSVNPPPQQAVPRE